MRERACLLGGELTAGPRAGGGRCLGGGSVATRDVFSEDELAQLRTFPEVSRVELIRHYTLAGADEAFLRKFRTGRNVLGAAVQLCTLPWLGFVPDDVPSAPAAAVGRLSQLLGIPMGELRGYGERSRPAPAIFGRSPRTAAGGRWTRAGGRIWRSSC